MITCDLDIQENLDEQISILVDDLRLCSASGDAAPTFLLDKAADVISRLNDIRVRSKLIFEKANGTYEKSIVSFILNGPCGFEIAKPVGYRHYDCVLEKGHQGDHQSATWA